MGRVWGKMAQETWYLDGVRGDWWQWIKIIVDDDQRFERVDFHKIEIRHGNSILVYRMYESGRKQKQIPIIERRMSIAGMWREVMPDDGGSNEISTTTEQPTTDDGTNQKIPLCTIVLLEASSD